MGGLHGRIFGSHGRIFNPHMRFFILHDRIFRPHGHIFNPHMRFFIPHDRIFGPHMRPHGQNRMGGPHGHSEHGYRPHTHMQPMRPHFKTLVG